MNYRVNVGNIGTVCDTTDKAEATKEYEAYVVVSCGNMGRAAGEAVTLFEDQEPIEEHRGYQHIFVDYPGWQLTDLISRRREENRTWCPVCGGPTPLVDKEIEVVDYDEGMDERILLKRKCAECGFQFKDIMRTVGAELHKEVETEPCQTKK